MIPATARTPTANRGWKYSSSPVPMTPYFLVEANTKHKAVITATVTKVMFSPVVGKTLKGKEPGRFGIRSVLRLYLRKAWGKL